MNNKSVVPTLRFSEFGGVWKNLKLGEIASFSKGKNLSKSDVLESGVNECIRYGELYTTYNETISNVYSKTNLNIEESVISEANDVIIPASGETQLDIATASCVLRDGIILGSDLNIIKTSNNGVFLSYYFNNKGKFDIARLSQGSSVIHLYSKQLATLKIPFPSLPEQQKIATFLTSVDAKITQLTKKKTGLEQYKKGVMQQLFSQEIRFKEDDGNVFPDWEEKRLGKISEITTGSSNRVDSSLDAKYTFFDRSQDIRRSSIFLFDAEAIIVAGEGQEFIPKYFKGKFDLHQRTYAIMNFKGYNGRFLFYYIHKNRNYFFSQAVGSTVKSLRLPMFKKMTISMPCLAEQTKIANVLSALDAKITQVTVQIETTTTFKKGLLQQLFV